MWLLQEQVRASSCEAAVGKDLLHSLLSYIVRADWHAAEWWGLCDTYVALGGMMASLSPVKGHIKA